MPLLFNYDELRMICWAFLVILLISFVIVGCIDLGVSLILPLLTKQSRCRTSIFYAINAYKTGGQLCLVFAAVLLYFTWPTVFSVLANKSYLIGLPLLFITLISPLGIIFRNKIQHESVHCYFDTLWCIGSIVSLFFIGVMCGRLFTGIPFYFDANMKTHYLTGLDYLLTPFSLVTGLLAITVVIMQSTVYLQLFILNKVKQKVNQLFFISTLITLGLFALAGYFMIDLEGYHIVSMITPNTDIHPLMSTVKSQSGLWLDNYGHLPDLWMMPITAVMTGLISIILVRTGKNKMAFVFSSFTVIAIILTAACSLFPFLLPSNIFLNSSLTLWDSTANQEILETVFWCALFYLLLIMIYVGYFFKRLTYKPSVTGIKKSDVLENLSL